MARTKKVAKKGGILEYLETMAVCEFQANGYPTRKYNEIRIVKMLMEEALGDNKNVYMDGKKMEICEIPSLVLRCGTAFDSEGVAARLRGLQVNYGEELVSVCTTLDLNYAIIHNIEDLLYEIGI